MSARRLIRWAAVLAGGVVLAACGTEGFGGSRPMPEPRDGRSGMRITGTVASRQIAVSDGAPRLFVGDCEAWTGVPAHVCFGSRDIDGAPVVLGIGNPDAFAAGETLAVTRTTCASAGACAQVRDGAVVHVQVGDQLLRAVGGSVTMRVVDERARYAGALTVELPRGQLTGDFDVVPRPD